MEILSRVPPEQLLAYYESYEVVELFRLWKHRAGEFPGLREKMRETCDKGPYLGKDENTAASSNRPRNDAFCFLVAGKLLDAGVSVVNVDGATSPGFRDHRLADVTFTWEKKTIDVQCKRPQSAGKLLKRATDARDQVVRCGRRGIIAIDCSVLCRPDGAGPEVPTQRTAEDRLSIWLKTNIEPKVRPSVSPDVLGFLLFARIPALTPMDLVDNKGKRIQRLECISSWLAVGAASLRDTEVLKDIAARLHMSMARRSL